MIRVEEMSALIDPRLVQGWSDDMLDELVGLLGDMGRAEWVRLAQHDSLPGSSMIQDYISGIQEVAVNRGRAIIALVGSVANMLEHGSPVTDLREVLLADHLPVTPHGERGVHEKDGNQAKYRSIPFRQQTPGTTGVTGQPMGAQFRKAYGLERAEQIGREVYAEALRLGPEDKLPAGLAPTLANPTTKTPHKTDVFAGLQRESAEYSVGEFQGFYVSFRTISEDVQDGSWIRQALPERAYAGSVADFVAEQIPDVVAKMMGG